MINTKYAVALGLLLSTAAFAAEDEKSPKDGLRSANVDAEAMNARHVDEGFITIPTLPDDQADFLRMSPAARQRAMAFALEKMANARPKATSPIPVTGPVAGSNRAATTRSVSLYEISCDGQNTLKACVNDTFRAVIEYRMTHPDASKIVYLDDIGIAAEDRAAFKSEFRAMVGNLIDDIIGNDRTYVFRSDDPVEFAAAVRGAPCIGPLTE